MLTQLDKGIGLWRMEKAALFWQQGRLFRILRAQAYARCGGFYTRKSNDLQKDVNIFCKVFLQVV